MVWDEQVRWMVVWRRTIRQQSWRTIRKRLRRGSVGPKASRKGPSISTMKRIVRCFEKTGGVKTPVGLRLAPSTGQIFSFRNDLKLLKILHDRPGDTLDEILKRFARRTGEDPHVSSVCRAIHRLDYSRKKVCVRPSSACGCSRPARCMQRQPHVTPLPPTPRQLHGFFKKRSEQQVRRFKRRLRKYRKQDLFFIDETSKDGKALRR